MPPPARRVQGVWLSASILAGCPAVGAGVAVDSDLGGAVHARSSAPDNAHAVMSATVSAVIVGAPMS
jgi:hypothetical protein